MEPLDQTAFEAFKKRCEQMGKKLPREDADLRELEFARATFQRTGKANIRHWGDYGGRPVYWFSYPQDLGALRIPEDQRDLVMSDWLGHLEEDRMLNHQAIGELRDALTEEEKRKFDEAEAKRP